MARLHINPKTLQTLVESRIADSDAGITVVVANQPDPETPEENPGAWCRVNVEIPPSDDNMYVKSDGNPILAACRVEVMLVVAGALLINNPHVSWDYALSITQLLSDTPLKDSPYTHRVDLNHTGYERFIGGVGRNEGADRLMHIVLISASGIIQRVK